MVNLGRLFKCANNSSRTFLRKKMILKTTLYSDDDFATLTRKNAWRIKYFFIKRIHKIVVPSEKLREFNSRYIDIRKIEVIPNGVVVPDNCSGLEDKENAFCYVGLVCERKRTYESIKYFINNYSEDLTSKMYIVGPYKNLDNNFELTEDYVNKCFRLVRENKLENRIIFTGLLSKEDVQKIFIKCKALLFFSVREGMPNVVLEAMANNCVPITSEMDGVIREIFEDKKQGFILDGDFEKINISLIDRALP